MFRKSWKYAGLIILPFIFLVGAEASAGVLKINVSGTPEGTGLDGRPVIWLDHADIWGGKNCMVLLQSESCIFKTCWVPVGSTELSSDILKLAVGNGQPCGRIDYIKNGNTYSTGNVQLTWNQATSAYTAANPSQVSVKLP
jgi:hypothetical protein